MLNLLNLFIIPSCEIQRYYCFLLIPFFTHKLPKSFNKVCIFLDPSQL